LCSRRFSSAEDFYGASKIRSDDGLENLQIFTAKNAVDRRLISAYPSPNEANGTRSRGFLRSVYVECKMSSEWGRTATSPVSITPGRIVFAGLSPAKLRLCRAKLGKTVTVPG
jgi:hypothetical protein